jgi:hypothetical protein
VKRAPRMVPGAKAGFCELVLELPQRPRRSRCLEITSREYEDSRVAGAQRGNLQRTISQSLVLGKHDPAPLARRPQPDTIFLVASKMVVMNLDRNAGPNEFSSNWLNAERPVDEEY